MLHLQLGGAEYTVDSRPSDAIALALRVAAPIFVDEDVVRRPRLEVAKEGRAGEGGRPRAAARSGCRTSSRRTSRSSTRPERGLRVRIGLFTNNYLPFCGGVTISVETLRRGLEARGHEVWMFAPRFPGLPTPTPRVVRYPSIPAATYPDSRWPSRVAADRAAGRAPRLRRLPCAPSVPARPRRASSGPATGPAARLHLPHALREIRALRAAARPLVEAAALGQHALRRAGRCGHRALGARARRAARARGEAPIAVVPTGVDLDALPPGGPTAARQTLGLQVKINKNSYFTCLVSRLIHLVSIDKSYILVRNLEIGFFCDFKGNQIQVIQLSTAYQTSANVSVKVLLWSLPANDRVEITLSHCNCIREHSMSDCFQLFLHLPWKEMASDEKSITLHLHFMYLLPDCLINKLPDIQR